LKRLVFLISGLLFATTAWAADKPIVLLAGATGETGLHIVRALSEKGYAVRGLTRDIAKAKSQNGEMAEWVAGDVRDIARLKQDFAGAAYAISAIGSREKDGPNNFENVDWLGNRNLIDAAKAAGVKHFVLMTSCSAGSGDWNDPEVQKFGAGRLWKGRAEAYLRDSGLKYTIVAPGGLRNYKGGEKGILLRPRAQYTVGVISRDDVAAVIVECLSNTACNSKTITTINADNLKPLAWRMALPDLPIDTPDTIRLVAKPVATEGSKP